MCKAIRVIGLLILLAISPQGASAPLLWFNPVSSEAKVGESVVLQLMAYDVGDLYGVELEIGFDPAVLEVVDVNAGSSGVQIRPGNCPSPDFVVINQVDNSGGTIEYAVTSLGPSVPCAGGTVADITFKGLAEGKSNFYFSHSILSDPDGQAISHSAQTAEINVISADEGDDLLLLVPALIAGSSSFAGTYSGSMSFIVTSPAGSVADTGPIVILLNRDRTVVVDPGTPYEGSGLITGNTATVDYPAQNLNTPGFVCLGTIEGTGILVGDTISGTLGPSSFSCNGIPMSMIGTFTASK